MIPQKDLDNWFSYHAPSSEQVVTYEEIRDKFKGLAEYLNSVVPDSPDKTAAFRDLRNCVMRFNLAIACNSD